VNIETVVNSVKSTLDEKIKATNYLVSIKSQAIVEVQETSEFDYGFVLGSFAYEYNLMPAKLGDEFKLSGAIHLELGLEKKRNYSKN